MDDRDLTQFQLDVYMTREGPWNPEDPWDEGFWYREIKGEAQSAVDDFLDEHRK